MFTISIRHLFIASVARADVLIYNGAGLEPWISSIVNAADNPNLKLVDSSADIQLLQVPLQFQSNNKTMTLTSGSPRAREKTS